MTDSDLTLKVLVEVRDEIRTTNRQLGDLRGDVIELRGEFKERLDVTNQRLEIIEHTMVDFGTQLVMLGRYTKTTVTRHADEVARHDDEIADLRTRVSKLEAKD